VEQTEPTVVDNRASGRFEIMVDQAVAGFAKYTQSGATVSFTHTEIDSDFQGRGLGSILARGALDAVRADGGSVLPFCPFIRSYIRRHPSYVDLVPADQRDQFELADAGSGTER
jgi:uncharacterized protein